MVALVMSMVLSQAAVQPVAPVWSTKFSWKVGERKLEAWASPVLVAELSPTDEGAAAVKRADATAELVAERPRVRLWRVKDAAAVRRALPALVLVVHDLPSTGSRARVPVGVVCHGEKMAVTGVEALERAAREPGCVPDFWVVGFRR